MSQFTFIPEEVSVPQIRWNEITKEYDDPEHRRRRRVLDTGHDRVTGYAVYSVGKGHDRVELNLKFEDEKVKDNETHYLIIAITDDSGNGEFHRISRTGRAAGNFYEAYLKTQGNVTTHRCDASFNGAWQTKEVAYSLKMGMGFSFTILTANGVAIYRHRSPCKDALRSIKIVKGFIHSEAAESLLGIFSTSDVHAINVVKVVVDNVECFPTPRMFEWARNVIYLNVGFLKEVDRDFVLIERRPEEETQVVLSPTRTRQTTRFSPSGSPSRGAVNPTFQRENRRDVVDAASTILSMSDKTSGLDYESIEDKAEVVANFDSFIEKNDLNVVLNFVEIPNIHLTNDCNPLFMLKEDARNVNQLLLATSREYEIANAFITREVFVICFLQILLTFSTCWPLLNTSLYSLVVNLKGHTVSVDLKESLRRIFGSRFLNKYRNPLRQYARYWSATVIRLIKREILIPNYFVLAKHGVCKEHIPYCFDFVVMDARYNSKAEKLGSVLARETALRNKGSRERVNLILSLYDYRK